MEYIQSKFLIKLKDYKISFLALGVIGIIIGFFKYDYFFRFFAIFLGVGIYFVLQKSNLKKIDLINIFLFIALFVKIIGGLHNYVELSKNGIISKGVVKSKGGYRAYHYANIEYKNFKGSVQLESVESAISNGLKQDASVWIKYSKIDTSLIIASVDKFKIDNSKNLLIFFWYHEPILSDLILIAIVYIIFLVLLGVSSKASISKN